MIQGVMRFPVMGRNDTLASILMGGNDVRRIGKGLRGTGLIAAGQLAANWVHI